LVGVVIGRYFHGESGDRIISLHRKRCFLFHSTRKKGPFALFSENGLEEREEKGQREKKKYVNDALPAAPFVFFEFLPRSGNRFLVYFLLMKRADCSALMANLRRRQNR
jgi:hypothetical protein